MNATLEATPINYLHIYMLVYTKPRKSITESRLTHLPRAGNIKRQIRISLDVFVTFGPKGHSQKCPDPSKAPGI